MDAESSSAGRHFYSLAGRLFEEFINAPSPLTKTRHPDPIAIGFISGPIYEPDAETSSAGRHFCGSAG